MEIWNTESSRVAATCRDIIRTNNRKGVTLRCVWNLVPIFVLLWRKGLKIFFAHNLSERMNLCSHISKHIILMLFSSLLISELIWIAIGCHKPLSPFLLENTWNWALNMYQEMCSIRNYFLITFLISSPKINLFVMWPWCTHVSVHT